MIPLYNKSIWPYTWDKSSTRGYDQVKSILNGFKWSSLGFLSSANGFSVKMCLWGSRPRGVPHSTRWERIGVTPLDTPYGHASWVKVECIYLFWITLSATWAVSPRHPVRVTSQGSSVTTRGNQSTRRKLARFGIDSN